MKVNACSFHRVNDSMMSESVYGTRNIHILLKLVITEESFCNSTALLRFILCNKCYLLFCDYSTDHWTIKCCCSQLTERNTRPICLSWNCYCSVYNDHFSICHSQCSGQTPVTSTIFETLTEKVGDRIFVIIDVMTNHYSFPQVTVKDCFKIQLKFQPDICMIKAI